MGLDALRHEWLHPETRSLAQIARMEAPSMVPAQVQRLFHQGAGILAEVDAYEGRMSGEVSR